MAYELAGGAFAMKESAGKVDSVIPVRFTIWAERSDLVAGDRSGGMCGRRRRVSCTFGTTRRSAMQMFLKGMREGFPGRYLVYDNEDVVLQQTWWISSMRVLEIYPRRQTIDIVFQR